MRIWGIEEASEYPPLALAVATIWTPARWRESRRVAWVTQADEALRALFPNIPEVIEGPWGSLSRSGVLGPDEAGGAMLDAIVGLTASEGAKIDPALEMGSYTLSSESLAERESSGKLRLGEGLWMGGFSVSCQAASVEIELPAALYKEEKKAALVKIDRLIEALDASLSGWMPSLQRMADPSQLEWADVQQCMAKARARELQRATPEPPREKKSGFAGRI